MFIASLILLSFLDIFLTPSVWYAQRERRDRADSLLTFRHGWFDYQPSKILPTHSDRAQDNERCFPDQKNVKIFFLKLQYKRLRLQRLANADWKGLASLASGAGPRQNLKLHLGGGAGTPHLKNSQEASSTYMKTFAPCECHWRYISVVDL